MTRADVAYLIADHPDAHGVHDAPVQVPRMVYCDVQSVGRREFYDAHNAGMKPEVVLKLSDEAEYREELLVRFHDKTWRIIRTYRTPDGGIELTLERSDVHA
jgi:hypothetical protein